MWPCHVINGCGHRVLKPLLGQEYNSCNNGASDFGCESERWLTAHRINSRRRAGACAKNAFDFRNSSIGWLVRFFCSIHFSLREIWPNTKQELRKFLENYHLSLRQDAVLTVLRSFSSECLASMLKILAQRSMSSTLIVSSWRLSAI